MREAAETGEIHFGQVWSKSELTACLLACLSFCLSPAVSDCRSVCLALCLPVRPPVCLSICLLVYLSVWLAGCLFVGQSFRWGRGDGGTAEPPHTSAVLGVV